MSHLLLALAPFAQAAPAAALDEPSPAERFGAALLGLAELVEPDADAPARTVTVDLALSGEGLHDELTGRPVSVAWQAPDRLRVAAAVDGVSFVIGRDRDEVWMYAPDEDFGVVGRPGVPRFRATPELLDDTTLSPFGLPISRAELMLVPLFLEVDALPDEALGDVPCDVLVARPTDPARERFGLPSGALTAWIHEGGRLPARLAWSGAGVEVALELRDLVVAEPWDDAAWAVPADEDDTVEVTALANVARFVPAALDALTAELPTLGPATGARRHVASHGRGRLEEWDGTQVLYLAGTPEEMGEQHGVLMRDQVHTLIDRVLYGFGVGSSLDEGRWFFGEIQDAQARLQPFVDERHLREMDAMALAAGLHPQEARLGNLFPELFHCSGFAIFGAATADGSMYHGRVLDYLRGIGLEQCATVIVHEPDVGHAWVNVGYAGFVGTVTAMNERRIAVGEMGGRGEGDWDGKPMAQLLREVMERASTLEEAIAILEEGPRTCEYYYVLSDGNARTAVGVAATPDTFELIWPGQAHPQLPHVVEDAVLMSAGDRYETLVERVRDGYGEFDAARAIRLMERPVCMTSNIHNALFAPETLEVWVANADDANVAAHTRYTRYDLAEMLDHFRAEVAQR